MLSYDVFELLDTDYFRLNKDMTIRLRVIIAKRLLFFFNRSRSAKHAQTRID